MRLGAFLNRVAGVTQKPELTEAEDEGGVEVEPLVGRGELGERLLVILVEVLDVLPPTGTNDSTLNRQGSGDPGPFRGRYCAEMCY